MTKTIDYFFSLGSPWSFIGLDAFVELAKSHQLAIRPFPTTLIEENGGIYSKNRPEPRRAYWMKDLKRWSKLRGKALLLENRPALLDPTPSSFMVIAAGIDGQDWIGLTRALQEAFWFRAENIGDPEIRRSIADKAGYNGAALLAREQEADIQARWRDNHEAARVGGVFGFPTYRYDGEVYWGQDNLPFLERHLKGELVA